MYHPSRGGVRGGHDQFKWDDVKVDKHRENYLGHSIMAPVGRWQKGKDLHWYARDKKSAASDAEAAREEIRRIKEEEEQAMREALGLAPKRASRSHGNRLDKHEYAELVKRGSAAEDLGGGHAEAAQVQGLGLYKIPHDRDREGTSLGGLEETAAAEVESEPPPRDVAVFSSDEGGNDSKKRGRDESSERRREKKHEKKREKKRRDTEDEKPREKRRHRSNH